MQGEISLNGVRYIWSLFGHVFIVTAPDGRQKKTQLGGSTTESLALLLAGELEREKPKN